MNYQKCRNCAHLTKISSLPRWGDHYDGYCSITGKNLCVDCPVECKRFVGKDNNELKEEDDEQSKM